MSLRKAKRNQILKVLARGIGLTLTGLSSMTSYGAYHYEQIQQSSIDFQNENTEMMESIKSLKYDHIIHELNRRLDKLNPVVMAALKELNHSDIKEFIQHHLSNRALAGKDFSVECTVNFANDIARGLSFKRGDPWHHVKDQEPIPTKRIPLHQQIEISATAIQELTKRSNDRQWNTVLQNAVTQTTLTALFDSLKSTFISKISADTWNENGMDMSLVLAFSMEIPPVTLELLRDPNSGKIKKVHVQVEGAYDIIKVNHSVSHEESELISQEAIAGKLSYYISLTKDEKPVVDDLEIDLISNVK